MTWVCGPRARKGGPKTKGQRRAEMGRETARLLPLLLPVVAAEILTVTVAASAFAASQPSPETLAGVWALLIVTAVAEAFPVPLENVPVGGTSLATIFIVGTSVIYGWEAAVIVAFVAQVAVEIGRRRDLPRVAYNGGVYALGAAATAASEPSRQPGGLRLARRGDPRRGSGLLRRRPRARRPRRFPLDARAAEATPPAGHLLDPHPLLGHDLPEPHARRALGPLAVPVRRARRPRRRDRAVPALGTPGAEGHAARADGSADRAREPPALLRAARTGGARGRQREPALHLPPRRGRLQADQRPLRPSRRRPGARQGRRPAPAGRRSVPASAATSSRCSCPERPRARPWRSPRA